MIPLRDESHKPARFPIVTVLLIAINTYLFFNSTEATIELFGLNAGSLLAGDNLRNLVTSMFLHGGILHLLFNMWSLWIFGDNVEEDLGKLSYLLTYLVSGIAGSYLFAFFADPASIAIGASGAIAGIMGAYLILHPRNRILALIPIGFFITTARIRAPIFILLWFLLQFVGFYFGAGSSIAYSAHIGGFIGGILLALLFRPRISSAQEAI